MINISYIYKMDVPFIVDFEFFLGVVGGDDAFLATRRIRINSINSCSKCKQSSRESNCGLVL